MLGWLKFAGLMVGGLFGGLIVVSVLSAAVGPRDATTPTPVVASLAAIPPTAQAVAHTSAPPPAVPQPTVAPTAPPSTPQPEPTTTPTTPERVVVTGAGADGVNMRAEPSASAARVKGLKDGAQLETVGADRQADGRTWRNVKDADGATGWVAADFVAAAPAAIAPPGAAASGSGTSTEARAYIAWLSPKVEIAGKAMNGLAQQSQAAGANTRLFVDNEWRTKTAVALAALSVQGQEMQAYPGPVSPDIRKLNDLIKSMGADYEYVASEYAGAIDQLSPVRMNNATARMNTANAKMKEATAEVVKLNTSPTAQEKPVAPAAPTAASKVVAPAPGGIVCKDGYAWPGTTRQGACNGHGGIR